MNKLLFSWVALNNDFRDGKVCADDSPNYQFHKHFYEHDKHIILSSSKKDDTRLILLMNRIKLDFPDHKIEGVYMDIHDVIDLKEIKSKVENLLLEHADDELDIFFSPGTSIMQVSWYICHESLNLKTRLIQTRPPSKTKSGKTEKLFIEVERSESPYTAILKQKLSEQESLPYDLKEQYLITQSLRPIYDKAYKIAQTDKVSTLILGESGTGKEHIARFIHHNSIRKDNAFIAINCSAFTDTILESRLFGHRKGSFTGAGSDSKGIFEQAEGGTVFLDEIGDISPYMQQSLLRVLQEKEFIPIGGKGKKTNVRVIAATNKDLVALCREGQFRWDLYYRLCIAELELPSLFIRGRKEIAKLMDFFLDKKLKELKRPQRLLLEPKAKELLLNYHYPGNVRELENLIETLYVFCEKKVSTINIPERFHMSPVGSSLSWKEVEKQHISKVLNICKGNQRRAWQVLGYGSLNTLKKKIKDYGIEI
jgi:DNA-binding NtrC family response regulator